MNFFLKRRKELRITQRQIALTLGITDAAVSAWECGRTIPRVNLYSALASVYQVPVERISREVLKLTPDHQAKTLCA